MQVNQLQIY